MAVSKSYSCICNSVDWHINYLHTHFSKNM